MKNYLLKIAAFLAIISVAFLSCRSNEEVMNLRRPVIEQFLPIAAGVGDTVTIIGKNFSEIPEENIVTFNKMKAPIKFASRGRLVVEVPEGATTGKLEVTVRGATLLEPEDFFIYNVPAPVITNVSPLEAKAGDEVTIEGQFFNEVEENNSVILSEVDCKIIEASATRLKIIVPDNGSSGRFTVVSNGRTATSSQIFSFKATAPIIESIKRIIGVNPPLVGQTPPPDYNPYITIPITGTVQAGELLLIEGQNFSPISSQNFVIFENDIPENANPVAVENNMYPTTKYVAVRIPIGLKNESKVVISVLGQSAQYSGRLFTSFEDIWRGRFPAPVNGYTWVIGENIYVLSGRNFWKYTPSASVNPINPTEFGSWSQMPSFGVTTTGGTIDANAIPRSNATTFVAGGKAYLIGGRNEPLIDVWVFDPTPGKQVWTRKQNFAPFGLDGGITLPNTGQFAPYLWQNGLAWEHNGKVYMGFNKGNLFSNPNASPIWRNISCNCPFPNRAIAETSRLWEYDYENDKNYNPTAAGNRGQSTAWTEVGSASNPGFQAKINEAIVGGDNVLSLFNKNGKVYAFFGELRNVINNDFISGPGILEYDYKNIQDLTDDAFTYKEIIFPPSPPNTIVPTLGTLGTGTVFRDNNRNDGKFYIMGVGIRDTFHSIGIVNFNNGANNLSIENQGFVYSTPFLGGSAIFQRGIFGVLPSGRVFLSGNVTADGNTPTTNFFEYIPKP